MAVQPPTLSTQDDAEERINSRLHGLAALIAFIAGLALVVRTQAASPAATVIIGVYVATLTMLFLVSSVYHGLPSGARKERWQLLDRVAIYLLIAGTITPISLLMLGGRLGDCLCLAEWLLALAGTAVLIFDRWLFLQSSARVYQVMGWLTALGAWRLVDRVPVVVVAWLALGGVAYIGGVLLLVRDRYRYFHAVSHLLAMVGAGSQFLAISLFLTPGAGHH